MTTRAKQAALIFLVVIASCTDDPPPAQPRPEEPERVATPQDVLAQVHQLVSSGKLTAAVARSRALITRFPGSAEADSAQRLIPIIESAARDSSDARRRREAESDRDRLASKWAYSATADEMTGGTTRSAQLPSENTVEFDFPYEGPQHGMLVIRNHPSHGQDVMLIIREGQILCPSYDTCTVRVRFDDEPPESWSAVGPADNSTTYVFIRGYSRFVQRLRKANVVRVQIPVFQQGQPIFEFRVGGYDHERFLGKR